MKLTIGVVEADVKTSGAIKESGGKKEVSSFICPKEDQVLIGRCHTGDENGSTSYKYGTLSIIKNDTEGKYKIISSDIVLSQKEGIQESNSDYTCEPSHILVGREHLGDENGKTWYMSRKFMLKNIETDAVIPLVLIKSKTENVENDKESDGVLAVSVDVFNDSNGMPRNYYKPMIGRKHNGDENKPTTTRFALFTIE